MSGHCGSLLTSGIALVGAIAIAAPSAAPPGAVTPSPTVMLVADAQALAPPGDYFSNLVEWWQPIFLPSASRPVPTPPSGIGPTPQSLPDTLEWEIGRAHV